MDRSILYETSGRAWVVKLAATDRGVKPQKKGRKKRKRVYETGQWTELNLSAHGGDLHVFLNHELTATLKDDPWNRQGHFGLQLRGGQEMEVYFKDLQRLKKIGRLKAFPSALGKSAKADLSITDLP
ncbi:MAG: family 16 glycoside hydrolase [Verrucomicrobiota bacterium]